MIVYASGKTPPPMPPSTRPTSMTGTDGASAATTMPTVAITSTVSSTRRGPYRSPSRPTTGVATAADSVIAVSAHAAPAGWVSRPSWICGSAGSPRPWTASRPSRRGTPAAAPAPARPAPPPHLPYFAALTISYSDKTPRPRPTARVARHRNVGGSGGCDGAGVVEGLDAVGGRFRTSRRISYVCSPRVGAGAGVGRCRRGVGGAGGQVGAYARLVQFAHQGLVGQGGGHFGEVAVAGP